MNICKIEGFTRILGAPTDWDHSKVECQGLPIIDRPDGWMVSQWKPSAEELGTLQNDGTLLLWVCGTSHPVVGIDVSAADGLAFHDAPVTVSQELAARNAEVKLLRMTLTRMQETLANQGRMCSIALASTGDQPDADDL